MGYILRPGVSCCRTGGYSFFLDTGRDRYFAITGDADAAFLRLVNGAPAFEHDVELIELLVEDGLLTVAPGLAPAFCRFPHTATESAIDQSERDRIRPSTLIEWTRIALARRSIRDLGLARTLARLENRKKRVSPSRREAAILPRIAAAFEGCNSIAGSLDQCLPRSIAVAHRMLDFGLPPTFIMGVRAEPFAAHAWVESGTTIVNDRFDTIDLYEPILVL